MIGPGRFPHSNSMVSWGRQRRKLNTSMEAEKKRSCVWRSTFRDETMNIRGDIGSFGDTERISRQCREEISATPSGTAQIQIDCVKLRNGIRIVWREGGHVRRNGVDLGTEGAEGSRQGVPRHGDERDGASCRANQSLGRSTIQKYSPRDDGLQCDLAEYDSPRWNGSCLEFPASRPPKEMVLLRASAFASEGLRPRASIERQPRFSAVKTALEAAGVRAARRERCSGGAEGVVRGDVRCVFDSAHVNKGVGVARDLRIATDDDGARGETLCFAHPPQR
ncbi:hypothetical protein C8F04DRAFT_1185568 [Mycena alexandri]|uniref:Uncharacterized protein n=1 Tax=Mycena alexandri TaxID=1745969 RepID=A0AAD6WYA2_9AGAR|nr:hypothetical protein C8F04DRAFT_1185568 [Mycena alexandri]